MANQISRIRSRLSLLYGSTTVVATVVLLLAIPMIADLTPQAVRTLRINGIVLGTLVLAAAVAVIQYALRPISDLGYALEIGSTPAVDLARDARRIALNAPAYLFVLSTGGVLFLSLVYNVVGIVVSRHHVFVAHLLPTLLSTAFAACGSLLVALVCQRWMHPVLRYTATRFQSGGLRITVRTRALVVGASVMALAILLPGSFGIAQAIGAYREHRITDLVHLLSAVAQRMPTDGDAAQLLAEAAGQLGATAAYEHLFIVDADGAVAAYWPEDGPPLGFDGPTWAVGRSSAFRRGSMDYVLVRLPVGSPTRWLGVGYALHPLASQRVRSTMAT